MQRRGWKQSRQQKRDLKEVTAGGATAVPPGGTNVGGFRGLD